MNLKGIFIKEEETQQQSPSNVKCTNKSSAVNPDSSETVGVSCLMSETVRHENQVRQTEICPDNDMVAKIWETVISKNLPGPDYIEFKNAAAGLVEITPDESMQMRGAFNVLRQANPTFTKDVILKSIDTYIGIVNEESKRGLDECASLRSSNISVNLNKVETLKTDAAKLLDEIAKLKTKYDSMMNDVTKLETEIAVKTNELDARENAFKASVQTVLDTLNADKTKVTNLNI